MLKQMIVAGGLILAAACNTGDRRAASTETLFDSAIPAAAAGIGAARAAPVEVRQAVAQATTVDRRIIRTAELRIQLNDVGAATRAVDSIAAAVQGLIANAQRAQADGGYSEASLTLRVPADRFAEALTALRSLGRVRVDNTNAEDITRSYNDLVIRLAVKRDMVARLRALLGNPSAKLADLVQVERELGRAITELEQMEGERRFLDNQVAMSTIHATFYNALLSGPGSFLDPVVVALREALVVLGRSVAAIISTTMFIAPWAVFAAAAWWLWRIRRRRPAASLNT